MIDLRPVERRRLGGRPPKLYRALGCALSMDDWAEVSGLTRACIVMRLKRGSSIEDALVYRGREFPEGAWEARGTAA